VVGGWTWADLYLQGGHFGGLEQPKAFLEDVEEFVQEVKDIFE
jgi:hypothetical protein